MITTPTPRMPIGSQAVRRRSSKRVTSLSSTSGLPAIGGLLPEFRADDPTASSVDRDLRNRSEIAVRQVEGHLLIKAAAYANQADPHTPIAGEVGRPACPGESFGDLDAIPIRPRRGW